MEPSWADAIQVAGSGSVAGFLLLALYWFVSDRVVSKVRHQEEIDDKDEIIARLLAERDKANERLLDMLTTATRAADTSVRTADATRQVAETMKAALTQMLSAPEKEG